MKTICVLGHKGKIGSQIYSFLSQNSLYKVVTFEGYLTYPSFYTFISKNKEIDLIINTISKFRGDGVALFESNVNTVNIVLQSLIEHNITPKIIHFSSGGVYSSTVDKKTESSPVLPSTYYLLCKSFADNLLNYYRDKFDIMILRSSSVYGENISDGFIYNMEKSAKEKKEVVLIGSPNKTRSILNIQYLLKFLDKIIIEDISIPTINLCTQTITLSDFIQFLKNKYKHLNVIEKEDLSDNDKLSHMNIDNSLAQTILKVEEVFLLKI